MNNPNRFTLATRRLGHWTQPIGALAAGVVSVALVFGIQWASQPTVDHTIPDTAALTDAGGEFTVRLRSAHSNYCLDTQRNRAAESDHATQQNCSASSLQRLTFLKTPDNDSYRIRRAHDGKCLEASSATTNNTKVSFRPCHLGASDRPAVPDNAQLWHLDQINTHYRVLSEATGEALVITGGSYSTWALITTRAAASSSDEYWQFEQRTNASTDPATMGQWGPLISWPFVPVHVAVLDDNRLLTWSAKERDEFNIPGPYRTFAAVYDINTGGFTDANIAQEDMFCSGTAQMADGRIFASGGNPSNNDSTQIFDPDSLTWQTADNMAYPRWYGTSLLLPDGDVLSTFAKNAEQTPERYSDGAGWSELPGASMLPLRNEQNAANAAITSVVSEMQWYAFMHLAPDGRVFHSGPTQSMHWFDADGVGNMQPAGVALSRNRQFGSSAMYQPGKLLITGGADPTRANVTGEFGDALGGTATAVTVDLNGATPVVTSTDSMQHARVNHNAVVLPTGEVLVVGGEAWGRVFSDQYAVFESEIWNPDTGTWRAAASTRAARTYHSWAVLLEDASVMSGGGGLCGDCGINHRTAQRYYPPYLYNADGSLASRPPLDSLASQLHAGENVLVSTGNATGAMTFSLVRASTATHAINTDQRFIPVSASALGNGVHSLSLPSNPNVLIPGRYWLFAVNDQGTPSVGLPLLIAAGERTQNTAPVMPAEIEVHVDDSNAWSFDIPAFDLDGQGLTFAIDSLPPGLSFDAITGRLSGLVTTDTWADSTVTASDGTLQATATLYWVITRNAETTGGTGTASKTPISTGTAGIVVFAIALLGAIRRRQQKPFHHRAV